MTGMIFQQWLEECLIPEMQSGSIVIIDNLPAHKIAGIRQCLEDAGMHLVYLPPYSPDFNPIEQVFAKLKALLSRMAPRSFDAICDAIGTPSNEWECSPCQAIETFGGDPKCAAAVSNNNWAGALRAFWFRAIR
jgi:putative transposase